VKNDFDFDFDRDFVSANGKVKDWDPGRKAGARCNVKEGVVGR